MEDSVKGKIDFHNYHENDAIKNVERSAKFCI